MLGVRFNLSEDDWRKEEDKATRGFADRRDRKRKKKEGKKKRMDQIMNEQERIRRQVCRFLAFLSTFGGSLPDALRSTAIIRAALEDLFHGEANENQRVERFIDIYVPRNPNLNDDQGAVANPNLDDFRVVTRIQQIMIEFMMRGLYEDAFVADADGESTSGSESSGDHGRPAGQI